MDTREMLRGSLEMRRIRKQMLASCLGVAAAFLFALVRHPHPDTTYWMILICSAIPIILAASLIAAWQILWIYRKPESYVFCQATLDQPHNTLWKSHYVYYSLVLVDPVYGYRYRVNTRAIFQRRGFIGLLADDYTGRTVTVAYNRETERVVVIG